MRSMRLAVCLKPLVPHGSVLLIHGRFVCTANKFFRRRADGVGFPPEALALLEALVLPAALGRVMYALEEESSKSTLMASTRTLLRGLDSPFQHKTNAKSFTTAPARMGELPNRTPRL